MKKYIGKLFVFFVLLLGCAMARLVFAADTTTFTPTVISVSDSSASEISNPFRGAYSWRNTAPQPVSWPMVDAYERYWWKDLEPTIGAYNFSKIETDLNRAKSTGGKLGIRIQMVSSYFGGTLLPQYLVDSMANNPAAGWFIHPDDKTNTFAPAWNDPYLIERMNALIVAIGAKYNTDPRLGFVDVGFYGNYGEWHRYNFPTWNVAMTSANKKNLISQITNTFSNKKILLIIASTNDQLIVNGVTTYPDMEVFTYGLGLSNRVGWRDDCIGDPYRTKTNSTTFSKYPDIANRWKTSPIVTEFCSFGDKTTFMTEAYNQVNSFHIGMLGNGNFGALSSYPVDQQAKYVELYKKLGYRFVLNSVTLPTSVNSGASLTISSAWSNVGVTPAYHPWQTYYQLINPSTNTVEWEGKSSVSLETFLPTLSAPVSATDTFVLPSTLKSGNYEVYVMVKDPDGYYKPLNLSIVGRTTNGNYKIGQIQVVSGIGTIAPTPTVVVTPTNTPIPTFTPTPTKLPTPTPTPISASPIITTTSLPSATRGRSYTATVSATDATISDTLSMTVTGLPTGITLKTCATTSSFSGTKLACTISGTPTSRKSYYPVFTVRDLSGKTGSRTLRLQVK